MSDDEEDDAETDDDPDPVSTEPNVLHSVALQSVDNMLQWCKQYNAGVGKILLLKDLQNDIINETIKANKRQKKQTVLRDFFVPIQDRQEFQN